MGVQDNGIQPIAKVIAWINSGHTFFTEENGVRANVFPKQHPTSRRWFLTTDPDSIEENNLDFLNTCT